MPSGGRGRTRTFEDNLKEHIRRAVNNPEIKGTEKLKWILAGIKMVHLEKIGGTAEHGSGFSTIDQDDDDVMVERGASNGHDDGGADGDPDGGPGER